MNTGCLLATIVGLILFLFSFIGLHWLIKEAFGPLERVVVVPLEAGEKLVCTEIYSADLADVFYRVDFKLVNQQRDTLDLGAGTFPNNNWSKGIEVKKMGKWIVIPVNEIEYAKLLMNTWTDRQPKEIEFSIARLKGDNWWASRYVEESLSDYGHSEFDTIMGNDIFVEYDYSIRLRDSVKSYHQVIQYHFDLSEEDMKMVKLYDRKEAKMNSQIDRDNTR